MLGRTLFAPSRQKLEKIASLELLGLQVDEISRIVNLTTEQVLNGIDSEEYKDIRARSLVAKGIKERELRKGWEGVEKKALQNVISYLDYGGNNDPEFALRAAGVAARARNEVTHYDRSNNNRPLPISAGGNVLVLTVHNNFASAISDGKVPMRSEKIIEHQKREDALPPGRVDELLFDESSNVKKIKNLHSELETMWEETG